MAFEKLPKILTQPGGMRRMSDPLFEDDVEIIWLERFPTYTDAQSMP
jgi:hypothetical protein